jgi:NAD(P)-dependent dehydrogenase (short-subunit alcohol dehydrogenase family)
LPPTAAVLVTGASSGIGRAAAERLARHGFRVFGASRRAPSPLPSGVRDAWIVMDVRDEAAVQDGVSGVVARAGGLDAVVCCAGYAVFGSVEDLPIEKARAQFETNVIGTLTVLRAALPHLRRAQGRAVVVGSLAGRAPIPFQSHYSASKAALDAITLALRIEVAPLGVGVSLVEPGDIATPFNDNMDWGDGGESAYAERRRRCERVVRESLPKAPSATTVADVILRALTARRPRVRYTVGPDSLLVPLGRRLLPDWLSLSLIRDHFKV